MNKNRLWVLIFALWSVLLSGGLASFVGSPGAVQALRLRSLLDSKLAQEGELQDTLLRLQSESERLEKDRVTQAREIRRVLGYAGNDEIIFDFGRDYASGGAL